MLDSDISQSFDYQDSSNLDAQQGYTAEFMHRAAMKFMPQILARLHHTSGDAVDLGCGTGTYTQLLDALGFRVTGIDNAPGLLAIARERLQERPVNLVAGSITELPLCDHTQDLALSMGVLQHVDDVPRVLDEMKRVLRPGGLLLIETLNRYSLFRFLQLCLRIQRYAAMDAELKRYSPWRLRQAVQNSGFVNVQLHGFFVLPPPFDRLTETLWRLRFDVLANRFFRLTNYLSHSFWIIARHP